MNKSLFTLVATLALTGCNPVAQLRCLVENSTDAILNNACAVEMSTQAIQENACVINSSTQAIKENRKHLEQANE